MENSKFNAETLVDLLSRNHYRAAQAIIIFALVKVQFMSAKTTSDALQ